jgi:hypothetical protein
VLIIALTLNPQRNEQQHFGAIGEAMIMVTQMSAERIGPTVRNVQHLPMPRTNHRDLVRFDNAYDERYKSLKDKIKTQTEKAPDEVQKRFCHEEGQ